MGACMAWTCTGCGFEYPTPAALFDHESGCSLVMRDRLEEAEAELTRLRAELAEQAAIHDEYRRLIREHLEPEIPRLTAELAAARALVEKREAQIEWLAANRTEFFPGGQQSYFEHMNPAATYDGTRWNDDDWREIPYDGTRSGLLAAVDSACHGDEK